MKNWYEVWYWPIEVWYWTIPIPKGDFDHMVKISPDWPPHSDFALELYRARQNGWDEEKIRQKYICLT
jgi:hypothetical protein